MSLWDSLSGEGGGADRLRPLLEQLTDAVTTSTETDEFGTWDVVSVTQSLTDLPGLDLTTGGLGGAGSILELRDPNVTVAVGTLPAPASAWRVIITAPLAAIKVPGLVGAKLDAQGQLIPDPAFPDVVFVVPQLRLRVMQLAGQSVAVTLLSATTTAGGGTDDIYEFVRMEPPYALIGPGSVVGFAYRSAVLDLSGSAGPSGVPAEARVQPDAWQGLFLPEVRLFVAPDGLEGIAVSAGVRNLWIGVGAHAGVTGTFEAEVVNRGASPRIHVRFRGAGGRYIADPGPGTALLPEHSEIVVDTEGGIAPVEVSIRVGSDLVEDDRRPIVTPATGTLTVTVTVDDAGPSPATVRTITVQRDTTPDAGGAGGSAGSTTQVRPTQRGTHVIVKEGETDTTVTVRLEPRRSVAWTGPGGTHTGETLTVPVAAGAPVQVTATIPAGVAQTAGCWFHFDRPTAGQLPPAPSPAPVPPLTPAEQTREDARLAWADSNDDMRTTPASTRTTSASGGERFETAMANRIAQIGAGQTITVDGYASHEAPGSTAQDAHNLDLSRRRLEAAVRALRSAGFTDVQAGTAHGSGFANSTSVIAGLMDGISPRPAPGASFWWLAVAHWQPLPATEEVCRADIVRTPEPPAPRTDPRPPEARRPDCFRKIGVRVEIVRDTLVRAEIYGEFDIETAVESSLARRGEGPLRTGGRNPSDGICLFLVRLRLSEDRAAWDVTGEFRAAEQDRDGLALMTEADADPNVLNILGALAVMAPLTASAVELSPAAGAIVALGSVALGASDVLHTHALMLRGGELVVSRGVLGPDGITAASDKGVQISILLDLEIAFSFDLELVRVDPAKPIVARYKAIGVRSQWETDAAPGGVEYVPLPVFDPSRGYSLDVPAGALTATPPLDEILRILGFRVSRDNPTYLEVEVGLGIDLGIVSVDAVRVRVRLDGPPLDLQLTKLRASIEIPGTLHGSGSLEFTEFGFKGAFDLTVTPVNIRVAAVLAVERDPARGVTGVLIGGRVEFPVPILLGSSGLGIYGFMGGIGVNYMRDESPYAASLTKALDWVKDQYTRPGQVMDPSGWTLEPGAFAFAAGIAVGTVDGGFTVHLDGIVVIEVPGPRLLLIMKADVLSLPPVFGSDQSATFLAVLDIDFGRGSILIALVAEYEIKSILHVRVPVTASFESENPENWFVDLGRFPTAERVSVSVLDVISGSGYLMVHGNGITLQTDPVLSVPSGFAVATGFHLQAVLMGSKQVGLYLEVAAGFDAILGLDPFYLAGIIYVRGELRLWIIGISASARLVVEVGTRRLPDGTTTQQPYVYGEVCGSVDFFFFSVKGCVSLTIGEPPTPTPTPRELVEGVSIIARTPAKIEGSGAGEVIDGKLGDAARDGTAEPVPVVPIDAIPIISFHTGPHMDGGAVGTEVQIAGATPVNLPGGGPNRWTRVGDRWWRYRVTAISLTVSGGGAPVGPGATPHTWLTPLATTGPHAGPTLALLDWLPTATPTAVPYGENLVETVRHQWGTACADGAPPARILWTFGDCPAGPSDDGWHLTGVAWPDPPGTTRGQPADTRVRVIELWRIRPDIDLMQGTTPARVIRDIVACFRPQRDAVPATDPFQVWDQIAPATFSADAAASGIPLDAATDYLAAGGSLHDLAATAQRTGWEPGHTRDPGTRGDLGCHGVVLRSPLRDDDDPAPWGPEADQQRVKIAWDAAGFRPHELGDAVAFVRDDDEFTGFQVLLLVDERGLNGDVVIRCEAADGTALDERPVEGGDALWAPNRLPDEWVDADGPWAGEVWDAGVIAGRLRRLGKALLPAFVPLKRVPDGTTRIVIGRRRHEDDEQGATEPFYVVAATGTFASETFRHEWDETDIDRDRAALSNALSKGADDVALLRPGRDYTLAVEWEATSKESETQPAAADDGDGWNAAPAPQTYRFRTQGTAPIDLDPWITSTTPSMDEDGVFTREKVRIVFATQRVTGLYDAYGRELRVTVRAASGHHPEPPGGGTVAGGFTLPVTADGVFATLESAHGVVKPWLQAALEVVGEGGLGCVNVDEDATNVYTLTLEYDFEPLTDYLVDIRSVVKTTGADPILVHRVGFTTSRFRDVGDLAALTSSAVIEHRAVASIAALAALPDAPSGAAVDEAMQQAGLGVEPVPAWPRTRVLWSTDAEPRPLAVVVECSEPMWRERTVPAWIEAPPDAPDPSHGYWAGRPGEWLVLRADQTLPAAGDLPRASVPRIIRGPGGTRAIALLGPNARGCEARFALVHRDVMPSGVTETATTAIRADLQRAPWESED
ncbi:hypothetical protein [Microbacterium invictum]|uniref:OmpA-like domain-containing protein n=1 Tax=Microbacterium invictum TaxID=515415 RepID=A0AA40SPJ6_9MICO|nr:hypothetical protein [Microbacterium invictum]MBB4140060.1 hypothetical protein [Microbacterium invictum]